MILKENCFYRKKNIIQITLIIIFITFNPNVALSTLKNKYNKSYINNTLKNINEPFKIDNLLDINLDFMNYEVNQISKENKRSCN